MDGVNGLLCAPDDANGLAQQIERFIVSPALRAQLAAAGQATVRDHFSIERTISAIEEYLHACVA